MNKIIRALAVLLCPMTMLAFSACSDDSNEAVTGSESNSCIVTAVVLGGIPCELHTTTSDGRDSTYEGTLTGANYPLSIDQKNGRIFLADSLPAGCDISRITFSTFSFQGRAVSIRSLSTATDTIFNAADSIDCRLPRLITVYAADGSKRNYLLELMVHKQTGEEMNWSRVATHAEIAALTEQKLLAKDGVLYLFGRSDDASILLISNDDAATWIRKDLDFDINLRSVCLKDGEFFALDGSGLLSASTDGVNWTKRGSEPMSLLVASSSFLFGVSDGSIWHSVDGAAWTQDALDEAMPLPQTEWNAVSLASRTNNGYEDVLLTGLAADGTPALWRRTIDPTGRYTFPWNSLFAQIGVGAYPGLKSSALVAYDEAPLLVGLNNDGQPALYISRDRGRSWLNAEIEDPAAAAATSLCATVDEDNNLFVICGGSGEVWRGKLARLGWKTVQKEFYRSARR